MTDTQQKLFNEMSEEHKRFFGAVLEEMYLYEIVSDEWPNSAIQACSRINEQAAELEKECVKFEESENDSDINIESFAVMMEKSVSVAARALRFWSGLYTY